MAQVIVENMLGALAFACCLAAIIWCMMLSRKLKSGPERFQAGVIGLIALHQGMDVLRDAGIWSAPVSGALDKLSQLTLGGLLLLSMFVLHFTTQNETSKAGPASPDAEANSPEPPHGQVDQAPMY